MVMRPHSSRFVATAAGTAAAAALASLAVVSSAPPAAATTPSAQSEYNAALKAIAQKGVHFESDATQSGTTLHVTGDTGVSSGAQTLTVTKGSNVEHMSVMIVGSTGYVKGNSAALHNVIGLPSAKSSKYADKWLSFPTSNATLSSLVAGLKNSEVVSGLQMQGPYKYGASQTIGGKKALAVRGTVGTQGGGSVPVVLYVSASGAPQPLRQVTNPGASTSSSDIQGTVTFSNWGENSTETAPAHSVSLLKLVPASGSSSSGSSG
jgi:hypothetical protein